ncbi:MAG: ATP-dependent helicase UvrD/PcrA, partial [Frankiaceae bacterium]|nr:ATP-dependent helicase UvrD/PcrA [Frankiaceae bacterium]
ESTAPEGGPSESGPPGSGPVSKPSYADAAAGIVRAALLEDVEQEAAWVADHLVTVNLERRDAHAASCGAQACDGWHQLAVLCRKRAQFGLLRTALEHRGVPVEVVGLGGLLDAPEVADVVAVLRVLHDPTSNDSMIRLLTGPRWRIGPRDLEALGRRARSLLKSAAGTRPRSGQDAAATATGLALAVLADDADVGALADAVERVDDAALEVGAPLSPEAQTRLTELRDDLAALRRRLGQPLPDLVADVERTLGLDVELEATPQALGRGRRANILAFSEVAANFVGIDGETHLGAFLASLDAAEQAEDGYDLGTPSPADTVKLLTVHAAKGLEWDVVAVPGLSGTGSHSVFPSARPSPRWPWRAERLPAAVRGDREDLPVWSEATSKGIEAYKAATRHRDLQEERRLAYVAVTRARDVLFCSGYWWGATAAKPYAPSSPVYDEVEAVCRAGAGTAAERPPQPAKDDPNPLLDGEAARDVPWPVPPTVPDGVRWAAEAVRTKLSMPAEPAGPADLPEPGPPDLPELSGDDKKRMAVWRRDAELLLREQSAAGGRPQVVLPADLSVSDVVELVGRAAELARRLHRPLPRQPAPAARRGTAFHAWLEQRHSGSSLLGPDDLPGAGDEDLPDDPPSGAGRPAQAPGELEVLQAAFLASSWGERVPIAVEVPFELLLGGHLVRGRIDAVYAAPDGTTEVVDYKTGRRPSGAAAAAAAVQLACYRLAWSELTGVDESQVGAAFLYVAEGDAGLVRPPLRDRAALETMLAALPPAEGPTEVPSASTEEHPRPLPGG